MNENKIVKKQYTIK